MGGEVQESAKKLKVCLCTQFYVILPFHAMHVHGTLTIPPPCLQGAVVARLADVSNEQHRPGLLRTLQLCEKFINSNAASTAAFQVLKEEVAKALSQQQKQHQQVRVAAGHCCGLHVLVSSCT
jgi:hypothetical protein